MISTGNPDQSSDEIWLRVTRQTGSHIRLTSTFCGEEHHVTIPDHKPLRIGTLSAILNDVANYLNMSKDEIIREIFNQ